MESLVGHPYVGQFGCFVVVRKALETLGKHIPDYAEGLREIDRLAALQERLAQHAVQVEQPQRGDIVLLRVMGEPGHIGIMLSPDEMLHCMGGTETCIERIHSPRWKGRIIGYWRV
jgi:cell wall-associated NlpC family hydrolase